MGEQQDWQTVLMATSNPGKCREIVAVMGDLPVRWVRLDELNALPEPVEDAGTFAGNAEKKALHYARLTGHWALAEDSGLVVDALDGAPGVMSARFAGEPRDDAANNAKLVAALAGVPEQRRTARFVCYAVLVDAERVLARAEGRVEGRIIDEPRGNNGFGYDPHFLVPELGRTTAELSCDEKNRISHRGQAIRQMRRLLAGLLSGTEGGSSGT